jgi:hypothetical protein
MSINERWEKVTSNGDEFLKFEAVEIKRSNRPDLHAFIMLNELFPRNRDIISAASHDQIWLDVDDIEVETLTDEQMIELSRCGVFYCDECCSLSMFV